MIGFYSAGAMGQGGGGTDPYWTSVASLLHFDGADASTTFTDEKGKTWTAGGNAKLSTTDPKFGSASLALDGSGDYVTTASHADFGFGTGDFTIEGWTNRSGGLTDRAMVDTRSAVNTGIAVYATVTSGGNGGLAVASNTAVLAKAAGIPATGAWYHWAVVRQSGTLRGYQDGIQVLSVADSRTYASASHCYIGTMYNGTQGMAGKVDDVRITKGVCRYPDGTTFTPPTAPFPNS